MATDLALAMAADHLFGDNLPSGAEAHINRLAELLEDFGRMRNEALHSKLEQALRDVTPHLPGGTGGSAMWRFAEAVRAALDADK